MSDPFLESILSSFDSQASIVWNPRSPAEAEASFALHGERITVLFTETRAGEWRVGFEVAKSTQSTSDLVRSSIRIFSGVFQAVEEFLTIRQPERLVFASKEEGLGRLYEAYLSRQDTNLRGLGYETEHTTKASPLAEYAIVKATPSAWSDTQSR
jgi:hypothetical protein